MTEITLLETSQLGRLGRRRNGRRATGELYYGIFVRVRGNLGFVSYLEDIRDRFNDSLAADLALSRVEKTSNKESMSNYISSGSSYQKPKVL